MCDNHIFHLSDYHRYPPISACMYTITLYHRFDRVSMQFSIGYAYIGAYRPIASWAQLPPPRGGGGVRHVPLPHFCWQPKSHRLLEVTYIIPVVCEETAQHISRRAAAVSCSISFERCNVIDHQIAIYS